MTTLVEFLTARYDELERLAEDAPRPAWVSGYLAAGEPGRRRGIKAWTVHGEVDSCTYAHEFDDCSTMKLLALPFSGHPDYQRGWAL